MEHFKCQVQVCSGRGSLRELKRLRSTRLMIAADPFFVKNGTAERAAKLSGAAEYEIFDDIRPDPTAESAARGAARVRAFRPDTLVALGGGSAMDCAKAMAWFGKVPLQLAAVPTTSGSGSEMTDFAVLTHENLKIPLVEPELRPQLAILDGELLDGLPPALIADGGFDVLSHALEAAVATGAGAFTDALARDSFSLVYRNLAASFGGNREVRQRIHEASAMAGLAFSQAGLGLCHGISHVLGGYFHVPHGRLNAILLPGVISCNAPAAESRYGALARQAGIPGAADAVAVRNLRRNLIRLRQQLNMPGSLRQAGIPPEALEENLEAIGKAAAEDPCCKTNPVPVTDELVKKVLREAENG